MKYFGLQGSCFRVPCKLGLLLLVCLAACGTPISPTVTPPSLTVLNPTHTRIPSRVPPTSTVAITATAPPTQTFAPATPTAAPTLTADQEQDLVLDLLGSNAGCQLPCWWGFMPGKTPWFTADRFFASLGESPEPYEDRFYVSFDVPKHSMQMLQVYFVSDNVIQMIWIGGGTSKVEDDFKVYGDPLFAQDWQQYMLPDLLATYGPPADILLEARLTAYEPQDAGHLPFHLLLFYPELGILVQYEGISQHTGDFLRLCPLQTDVALWLWRPERKMTLNDIASTNQDDLSLEAVPDYRPLKEATSMSLETFYKKFTNADASTCLETPARLWPAY